jgi:hypothetical protein
MACKASMIWDFLLIANSRRLSGMRAEGVNTAQPAEKILREEILLWGRQRSPPPCEAVVDLGGKGKKRPKTWLYYARRLMAVLDRVA